MPIKLNRGEEIIAQWEKEGRSQVMDSPEFLEMMSEIGKDMEQFRQEYKRTVALSWRDASKTILTA
ncbi:hypothetical protein [Chitinophaga varians]|uniref:hypothetical protein n=1 Tax=Chitinophaga varians TaxID=2202339 RepID=UPI00165F00C6|nr:hypothetical protein [Chitinophaga varians]MBC9909546.1 hypothetical protein [Chitinophaga varians]